MAHWIFVDRLDDCVAKCSACGKFTAEPKNFCGFCGGKMAAEENKEEVNNEDR